MVKTGRFFLMKNKFFVHAGKYAVTGPGSTSAGAYAALSNSASNNFNIANSLKNILDSV